MEPALIVVTLMSLAMAVAMSVIAWRLLREERRRSAARVAALADLAEQEERREPLGRTLPVAASEPEAAVTRASDLFATREPATSHRALALAVAAVLIVATVAALTRLGGRRTEPDSPVAAARLAPLELVSLRHSKHGETLTIVGLVRNPGEGRELQNVTVVAFVFDQAGVFLASGRTGLEAARLAPGAESPFAVTIANTSAVSRYRIGFRTEDGRVLGHVDRRPPAATTVPERARATALADPVASAVGAR